MDNPTGDILSSLLSNPESLKLLSGIAKSFLSSNADNSTQLQQNNQQPLQTQSETAHTALPLPSEQISAESTVVQSQSGLNSFENRANLIKSIKPYLAPDKREKADSLIKALNVAKLINTYAGDVFK